MDRIEAEEEYRRLKFGGHTAVIEDIYKEQSTGKDQYISSQVHHYPLSCTLCKALVAKGLSTP
jgi:hypothetical protein